MHDWLCNGTPKTLLFSGLLLRHSGPYSFGSFGRVKGSSDRVPRTLKNLPVTVTMNESERSGETTREISRPGSTLHPYLYLGRVTYLFFPPVGQAESTVGSRPLSNTPE